MDGIPAIAEDLRDLLRAFIDHEVRVLVRRVRRSLADRHETRIDALVVPVIGRAALLANKRALGRTRDLADIELLEGGGGD
jgi:hypothetical protein